MTKDFDKEAIEVAVAIQGNITGIIGMVGLEAFDEKTKKELVEQTVEVIVDTFLAQSLESSHGHIAFLNNSDMKTIVQYAEKITGQAFNEAVDALKGVNMDEPSEVFEALAKTSIAQGATAAHFGNKISTEGYSGKNAMSSVLSCVEFCKEVNRGNSHTAKAIAEAADLNSLRVSKGR